MALGGVYKEIYDAQTKGSENSGAELSDPLTDEKGGDE